MDSAKQRTRRDASERDAAVEALKGLVERESGTASTATVVPVSEVLQKQLDTIVEEVRVIRHELRPVREEMKRLKTDDRVLSDMSEQFSHLSEEYHEREVLTPIALALIGILDRRQLQTRDLEAFLERREGSDGPAYLAARQIVEARRADSVEIQNLLANYGIEPLDESSDDFQPETQKCISRVPAPTADHNGRIAERLLPGYKRGQRVIRRECVSIYAASDLVAND